MTKIYAHHLDQIHAMRESGKTWKQIYTAMRLGCDIGWMQKKYQQWRRK